MVTDLFARIGDIKGESADASHKDEIEVVAWSWGVANDAGPAGKPAAGKPAVRGKARFSDFSFTHVIDRASPVLMKACATGTHFKEAIITARKAGGRQQDYLIIKFKDVVITNVSPTATREDGGMLEMVGMQYGKVDVEYRAQKADGSLDAGIQFKFDLQANKAE